MANNFLANNHKFIRKLRIFMPTKATITPIENPKRQCSNKSETLNNKNNLGLRIIFSKFLKLNLLGKEKFSSIGDKFFEKIQVKTSRNQAIDEIFYRRITEKVINYIEEISHMDEVRDAQKNVMDIKDNLKESGDRKREISLALNIIGADLQKIHSEICAANRGTERFLALITEEVALIKDQKKKQLEFNKADELERQLFNHLTTAINDSYEKEKIHSNFIKVLGVIGALLGSILTLIASAVGHFYHNTMFGILANDFKENVSRTLQTEFGSLKDTLRLDLSTGMKRQEELLRKMQKTKEKNKNENSESWGGYIHRHSVNVYRYFIPKRTTKQ